MKMTRRSVIYGCLNFMPIGKGPMVQGVQWMWHVKSLKLKEQNVDGIIMDLRNNGGGSLYDVVQMVGFFIDEGPIVQVKDRDGNPNILRDRDKTVLYDGPLAVMVNEFSVPLLLRFLLRPFRIITAV